MSLDPKRIDDPVYVANYKKRRREQSKRRTARRAEREGREYQPLGTRPSYPYELIRSNAIDAFNYWLKVKATPRQVKIYCDLIGEPWINPRIKRSERVQLLMDHKVKNAPIRDNSIRLIELTGKHAVGSCSFAVVDSDVYEAINEYRWKAKPNGAANCVYAVRNATVDDKLVTIRMHREVLKVGGANEMPLDIDHINRNPLDNRKANLRAVSRRVNVRNSARFDGARVGV